MKTKIFRGAIAMIALMVAAGGALADDIDIYSANTSANSGAPNVLIVLDNTANWSQSFSGSTKFAAEKAALAQVINALKTQFNLGVMMFTETGSPNSGPDGGYVRFAIQPMTDSSGNPTNARNCLLTMIGGTPSPACTGTLSSYYTNLDINNDKSNGGKAGVTMGEVYDYYANLDAYAGDNKVKADPLAFASSTIAGPTYLSPISPASCQKNFVIVINNGPFSDNSSDTATATSQLSAAGGDTTTIPLPGAQPGFDNVADEWTRFLNKVSTVNAVTYTLEVGPETNQSGTTNTALLQSMGIQGKGGYYAAIDSASLLAALTRIFDDIQAVNSVFASSSLPLSADNSGAFANQVYMGVFRPDGGGGPRWLGNLKQYKFAVDSNGNLSLVDALNNPAAGSSGFAQPDAVSFWTSKDTTKAPDAPYAVATNATTGSTGGFYFFDAKGSGGTFDLPDGEWVEKGGAAQQLRLAYLGYGNRGGIGDTNASTLNSLPARKVYTCTGTCLTASGTALSATPFDSTNTAITSNPAAFGINATVNVSTISSTQAITTLTAGSVGSVKSISSLSVDATGTVATVATSTNHGYATNDYVTISGSSISGTNGTFQITKTGPKAFTYPVVAASGTATGTITATAAGTTATVTIAGTPHNLTAGMSVTIAGAFCPSVGACPLNGTFPIATVPTANSFTYTIASPVGATATGTITAAATLARAATTSSHGFQNGDSVVIVGAACASGCTQYNGTFTISNVTSTTFDFSYSASGPLADATSSGMTATDSATTSTRLATLLKWIRGLDTSNENGFQVAGQNTDVRPSIHGDVLHTRPVVLNYGTPSTADNVYVFYGGNDGVFRAVKGGQAATDGNEQWAFIPQEFYGKFLRQYNDSPDVLYPSTPSTLIATPTGTCDPSASACAEKRDYFWDGPVGSYVERDTTGAITKAYLYIAARRGGRFIYALDVTTPTAPKILWRKGCTSPTDDSTCDAGFAELGQTWSLPQVATVHDGTTTGKKVLIFGAGYDPAEDTESPIPTADTKGRAIYVLDALTGDLLWTGGQSTGAPKATVDSAMTFSVAADVLVVDRNSDGFADRLYAADVGGNVWRVDINDADMSNWKIWHVASISDRSAPATTRKFLFGPDVVFGDTFDAIVIGSGDREHPLAGSPADLANNRVYMFEDPNTGFVGSDLNLTEADLTDVTNTGTVGPTAKGWYVTLATGEKVINGPLVLLSGAVVFGTNQPDTSNLSCTGNLGIARRYDINYLSGAPVIGGFTDSSGNPVRFQEAVGGGFLPSPVAGVVEINGNRYTFATDNPLNPGGLFPNKVVVSHKRFRTYWHEILE